MPHWMKSPAIREKLRTAIGRRAFEAVQPRALVIVHHATARRDRELDLLGEYTEQFSFFPCKRTISVRETEPLSEVMQDMGLVGTDIAKAVRCVHAATRKRLPIAAE